MTHEKLLQEKESVSPGINTFSGDDYSEDPSISITLETYLQALSCECLMCDGRGDAGIKINGKKKMLW